MVLLCKQLAMMNADTPDMEQLNALDIETDTDYAAPHRTNSHPE